MVLEGRDRVGGRSYTGAVAGLPVDLGGTFVGPGQDAVLALAAELGCPTTPTYCEGSNLINWRGVVRSYSGTIPALSIGGLLNVAWVRWRLARLARRVPVDEPWAARGAAELDARSLREWLGSVHASSTTLALMAIMSRVTWGADQRFVVLRNREVVVRIAPGEVSAQAAAVEDRQRDGRRHEAEAARRI